MAIATRSLLESYDNVDRTSYTFLLSTPASGEVLGVFATNYGASTLPTISDDKGHTWTQRASVTNGTRRITFWTAPDNGVYTAPTITVDFGGVTQTGCAAGAVASTGVNTTTNDGVVQAPTGTGTSTTAAVTMSAFGSANNTTTFRASSAQNAAATSNNLTNSTGFPTEVANVGPSQDSITCNQLSNNTAPQAVWASSVAWLAVGVEWKAAAGGSQSATLSATCATAATLVRGPQIVRSATSACTASLVRTAQAVRSAAVTMVAVVVRTPSRVLAAASSTSAAISAQKVKVATVSAVCSTSATMVRRAGRTLAGVTAAAASAARGLTRGISATCFSAPLFVRRPSRTLSGGTVTLATIAASAGQAVRKVVLAGGRIAAKWIGGRIEKWAGARLPD